MHFQTFRLQPPHAPLFRLWLLCSGQAWPPIRVDGLSAVLRTSFSASSLVSRIWPYRVRCGDRFGPLSSTDYPFTFSCSPPHLAVTQLLSVTGVKLRQRGTSTLRCTLAFKRTSGDREIAGDFASYLAHCDLTRVIRLRTRPPSTPLRGSRLAGDAIPRSRSFQACRRGLRLARRRALSGGRDRDARCPPRLQR